MIDFIRVLKKELRDKEIYLWDIGMHAMQLFYSAAIRGIDFRGIVTNDARFWGDTILHRPIISTEDFRQKSNAVLLASDKIGPGTEDLLRQVGRYCRWTDAVEMNPELRDTSLSVVGTDSSVWECVQRLDGLNATVASFLSLSAKHAQRILNVPVLDPPAFLQTGIDRLLFPEHALHFDMSGIDRIREAGFTGTVYLSDIMPEEEKWSVDFWVMLDDAMKTGKRILFCCEDPWSLQLFRRFFDTYGIPVSREVSFEGSTGDGTDDLWSLADEDPEHSVLLIHAFSTARRYEIADAASALGYSLGAHSYAATNIILLKGPPFLFYEHDEKLGVSIDYSVIGGLPGWAVYGDAATAEHRIMVLGGSTSSEGLYPESWVSKLYKKLLSEGRRVVIYNGAHPSNGVFHELNRLIRDVRYLKPDIVISMSGYNDMGQSRNKFEALRKETPFDYWRRMQGYMKQIAESEGAVFYAVLQPVNRSPENRSLYELLRYHSQSHRTCREFAERRRSDDFYHDLYTLFLHRPEMLIDCCHYSEQGNSELSEQIYQIIKGSM